MKQRGVFLIGVILMGIYYFLFPRESGRELVIVPRSFTALDTETASLETAAGKLTPVRTGSLAAYFDDDFRLVSSFHAPWLAVADDWLVVAEADGSAIREPDGRLRARLPGDRFPLARDGSLLLYDDDIGRLARVDPMNGREIWSRDFLSPVTVLDAAADRTLVGLLDGRVVIIDGSGRVLLRYRPGGSRVEAVYGGCLSADGTRVALITGLDPQRFILLEERKNGFRPVTHHDTGTDYRRRVPIGFISDDRRVLYEAGDSVTAVNTDDFSVTELSLDGRPAGWNDDENSGSLALLARAKDRDVLRILSRHDRVFFECSLDADMAGVAMEHGHLMLTGPDYLGVLDMEVR